MENGQPVNFDLLGLSFSHKPIARPRGPEMRSNRLNFFNEITADEMKQYSPGQIATILKQRDHLHDILEREVQLAPRMRQTYYMPSTGSMGSIRPPPGFGLEYRKPWAPSDDQECQFKCCHTCRPTCASRSYLSLDGIANGDIPSTATSGFGFHLQGSRPVMNADIVKDIGCRPSPLPPQPPELLTTASTTTSSPESSIWSILDIIDEQMVETARLSDENAEADSGQTRPSSSHDTDVSDQLKSSAIRPPWTPPATPSAWDGAKQRPNGYVTFEKHPVVSDGRSPDSLKTNPHLRQTAFESVPANSPIVAAPHLNRESSLYAQVDVNDVGLFLPFNERIFEQACDTPLPPPSASEDAYFNEKSTLMMDQEMEEGRFLEEPLDVADGLAMTEECVALRVPDVMTGVMTQA